MTTQGKRRSKEFYAVYLGINPSWPKVQAITIEVWENLNFLYLQFTLALQPFNLITS